MNNNYLNSLNLKKFFSIIIYALVLLGIYLTSFKSYLLFHSIAEVFSIVIACGIFLLAWNTRRLIDNHYLLFLGIAYLFVGTVDFVHTLAFKGMNIFSGYDANLPTQLWIIARYLESISIFLAPIFLIKRLNPYLTFIIYLIVTSALFISIFTIPVFPDCFIEGKGLTLFKIISEYIISSILSASILVLLKFKEKFEKTIFNYILWSIILTICSELAFTFYVSVYDLSNMIGHFLKIISFYLIYKAIFEIGVSNPYSLLIKDLKENEMLLKEAQSVAKIGHWVFNVETETRKWSEEIFNILDIDPSHGELTLEKQKEIIHPDDWDMYYNNIKKAIQDGIPYHIEFRIIRSDNRIRWLSSKANIAKDSKGKVIRLFGTVQDITELKETEEVLYQEKKRFLTLIENVPFGLILIDKYGNFVYVNPKFKDLFGYDINDIPNIETWFILAFPEPEVRKKVIQSWFEELSHATPGQKSEGVFNIIAKDKKEKIVDFTALKLHTGEQIVSCLDITKQKILEKNLEKLSLTDELTGLYNRRGFIMLATQQIKIAERAKKGMLLFFIDLDHMKDINDSLGHQAGDMAIIEAASIMKDVFRESDILGRIGGDEFAVLAIDTTDEIKNILITRLNKTIATYNSIKDRKYMLSFSVGVSCYDPNNPVDLDTLMSSADDLMYREKRNKKSNSIIRDH
ncbi:MAG TPA: MASE3 domain-containing protein [Syntrophorhabdaceae bacterium]|nr:MASE3 domain-containing protein [Syntrophorhabdaceae bacterium]